MNECLIDTDTLSFFLRGDKNVTRNVEEYLRFSGFNRVTISVITLANNFSLVTNNVKHYEKIENLIIHNWKEDT